MAHRPKKPDFGEDDSDDDPYKERSRPVHVVAAKDQRTQGKALGLDDLFGGPVKRPAPQAAKVETTKTTTQQVVTSSLVTTTTTNVGGKSDVQSKQQVSANRVETTKVTSSAVGGGNATSANTAPTKNDRTGGTAISNIQYKAPNNINTYETLVAVKAGSFNRPAYIRKFKKIADNYGYRERNERSIEVENVLRLSECYYGEIKKLNRSDFADTEFPANYTAFVDNVKERKIGHFNDWNNWSTPRELFRAPALGKYIDPNDIERGLFASDYLVSCLASLAERETNIKRLIEEQTLTETGFYYVRLNVNGVWRYIVVDHKIPVHKDGRIVAAHSYADDESDLWPTLIEKAYTKVYGSYEQYSRVQSRESYLRDLTGAPVRLYVPTDPNLLKLLEHAIENEYVVQAAPSEKLLNYGLNPNLTLSVIKVDIAKKTIQFRSSFGTVEEKARFNLSREGTFEVSVDETRNFLNYFLVAEVHDSFFTSTIQARHRAGFFSSYSFRVRDSFEGYLMASQFDSRHFNQTSNLYAQEAKVEVGNANHYENSALGLIIYRKDEDLASEVTSGSARAKNVDVPVSLPAGEYIVFLTVNWVDRDYDFNISAYGTELVTFKRIHNKNNPSNIATGINAAPIVEGPKIR